MQKQMRLTGMMVKNALGTDMASTLPYTCCMTKRHKWHSRHHTALVFCTDDYTLVHEHGCIESDMDILGTRKRAGCKLT